MSSPIYTRSEPSDTHVGYSWQAMTTELSVKELEPRSDQLMRANTGLIRTQRNHASATRQKHLISLLQAHRAHTPYSYRALIFAKYLPAARNPGFKSWPPCEQRGGGAY